MEVKIFNLAREYEEIKEELTGIFDEVLKGGEFILGPRVRAFEEEFARYTGVGFAAGVGSGTDALRIGGLRLVDYFFDLLIYVAETTGEAFHLRHECRDLLTNRSGIEIAVGSGFFFE